MPRPAKYQSKAEKQKAYRERLKNSETQQSQDTEMALMLLEYVKSVVDAYREKEGFRLEALYGLGKSPKEGDLPYTVHGYVGSKFSCQVEMLVFLYLTKSDLLEKVSRGGMGIHQYRIK